MSRQLGNYASRTQFCEVVIEITKLYVFQENKSRWKSRCLKIEKQIILPNITGGYITKADKTTEVIP
jgi:hypothetical protein